VSIAEPASTQDYQGFVLQWGFKRKRLEGLSQRQEKLEEGEQTFWIN